MCDSWFKGNIFAFSVAGHIPTLTLPWRHQLELSWRRLLFAPYNIYISISRDKSDPVWPLHVSEFMWSLQVERRVVSELVAGWSWLKNLFLLFTHWHVSGTWPQPLLWSHGQRFKCSTFICALMQQLSQRHCFCLGEHPFNDLRSSPGFSTPTHPTTKLYRYVYKSIYTQRRNRFAEKDISGGTEGAFKAHLTS